MGYAGGNWFNNCYWKSLVVVDGDGNVKQENKRKKKSEEKQRFSLTFEIGSVTLLVESRKR
jgi:hypothetical protein